MDTATTETYTLSLHDALPIFVSNIRLNRRGSVRSHSGVSPGRLRPDRDARVRRSEEHTSELQSPYDLVCRLLLEKKKINVFFRHRKLITNSVFLTMSSSYTIK